MLKWLATFTGSNTRMEFDSLQIGVSELLPFGIPEDRRRSILTLVDNTGRIEYAKDRPVNRVASRNISRLPFGYEDKLLAVKGHDQKVYFESLGLSVVELKSVLPYCPKYADLPEEVFHPKTSPRFHHSIHYRHDDSKCSRIIAIAFTKYLEIKRREESDKYWDDEPADKSSKSSDWGKYWDEQAESSEFDEEPADKPIPESSEWDDEPANKPSPESSEWGNYWNQQASKEPKQPAAADEQAGKEPKQPESSDWGKFWDEQTSKEPKQPAAADEPASKKPKQYIVWKDKKDVIV
ncbi:hypothetical protein AVEN_227366-1 [Araneus ventricosus]|uniref:Uncharacterized protein n=1 Tax=Araneus ventricosus TaxID=182803 RepID=A0A4Y2GXM2_ARAVE|nr:hypothetical protein AVEN_227366-1 [Araneus ventricosus]